MRSFGNLCLLLIFLLCVASVSTAVNSGPLDTKVSTSIPATSKSEQTTVESKTMSTSIPAISQSEQTTVDPKTKLPSFVVQRSIPVTSQSEQTIVEPKTGTSHTTNSSYNLTNSKDVENISVPSTAESVSTSIPATSKSEQTTVESKTTSASIPATSKSEQTTVESKTMSASIPAISQSEQTMVEPNNGTSNSTDELSTTIVSRTTLVSSTTKISSASIPVTSKSEQNMVEPKTEYPRSGETEETSEKRNKPKDQRILWVIFPVLVILIAIVILAMKSKFMKVHTNTDGTENDTEKTATYKDGVMLLGVKSSGGEDPTR